MSPLATHCCHLPLSAAALVVCNRICYEMAETGRLVEGSQQKAAAYLTIGHRLPCFLVIICQATLIDISVHHCHSPLFAAIRQGTTIGGETSFVVACHCCIMSMILVARFTCVVIHRRLSIILLLSTACFCKWSSTAANHSCKLQQSKARKKGRAKTWVGKLYFPFISSCGHRGGGRVGLHTCCRRPSPVLLCYHELVARGVADPITSRRARNPPLLAWRHQWLPRSKTFRVCMFFMVVSLDFNFFLNGFILF